MNEDIIYNAQFEKNITAIEEDTRVKFLYFSNKLFKSFKLKVCC